MNKVHVLLCRLGIPKKRFYAYHKRRFGTNYTGPFWKRPQPELLDLLFDAREKYRQQIKTHHPDKGGKHGKAAEINVIWSRIRYLFARNGLTLP